jgi:signal transduction histidine kinase
LARVNFFYRLLQLARSESGQSQTQAVPQDLGKMLSELSNTARLLGDNKQIRFCCHIEAAPTFVMGDEVALRELFLILLDNAFKYTPATGLVELRLTHDHNLASVEVRDTGIGIAADDLPHIYDRFWRADKARSREMGGAGLGLSIAKWIVDQCQGSIHVESELGRGSKFSVQLPLLSLAEIGLLSKMPLTSAMQSEREGFPC